MGDLARGNPRLHISYSLETGWRNVTRLQFKVRGAASVAVGPEIYLLGGGPQREKVHVYNTQTHEWTASDSLPHSLGNGSACLISPTHMVVCSEGPALLGEIQGDEEREIGED
ncbi:hypothetical protein KIPB_005486 [Kipferlia bialata]|uniref:Kelch-type beta propeller n=1 Tax=Kipferlia bialata TaxID=797122 RepID=A0A9K3GJ31_9EUKA|nr:hypothetical protein KIPB_005486 [Kipferlia bialata]|eukprot:g5486.t1